MATTTIPANCATVNQALMLESGRLGGRMYGRAARKRPIVRLVTATRGAWKKGMGTSISAVTFERSFAPLIGDAWTNTSVSDGDSANACLPPTDTVSFGQTSRSYQPKHYAINTEHFCIKDIEQGFQYVQFLNNVTRALEGITEWVWARRFTIDYFTIAGHKITVSKTLGLQDSATVYNVSNLPTSGISQGILDNIYLQLWREGGDAPSGTDEATGAAVFSIILSSEASDRILKNNPEIRADVRYAFMGKGNDSPLIPGMPTKRRHFGNYIHEIDPYPRRYTFGGGGYIEIAPFIASGTTKGNKWELNPAYTAAPFEEAIIYHSGVYQSEAVNTAENPAPGWNFSPRDWMGSFSWRNILHETCNPDGTIGFFRALFSDAARPIDPSLGYTLLFQRCGPSLDLGNCYES